MRKLFLFFSLGVISIAGFSQNLQRYNWYFSSSNQAIRFNRTSGLPAMVTKAIPFGAGGSATASDPANANLLFYTDGTNIYDATNVRMPAGFGLTANAAANQPVAVCRVPGAGNEDKYFVFTNTANFTTGGAISVSVVDMKLFGNSAFPSPPLGDIESKNVVVPGLPARAEGMIIVPHSNGNDFWLITQQVSSAIFTATLIDAASYTGTFNSFSTSGVSLPTTVANFAYHEGTRRLGVSPQDPNTNALILRFDNTTGAFAPDKEIFNSGLPTTTNQSVYDMEFSLTGNFVYLSRFGEAGIQADLLQYDYLNPTTTLTTVLPAPVFRSFGVQLAPDSAIYHLYQSVSGGPILIGKMVKPDTIAAGVNYKTAQLTATSLAGTQFPAFLPKLNVLLTVDFTFIGTCQNNNTTFFPDVKPAADSVQWDFGDMSGSSEWSPVHKYTQGMPFNVTMTAFYQGNSQSVTKPISIQPFTLQLNLVQDTTACRSEFPPPRGTSSPVQFSVKVSATGGTPTSYTWSNGDLGPTLTPDSAGYYYVVVSDGSGCSVYAGVNVKEYGLQDQRSNIWYFGQNAGIDFNVNPPVALGNSAMDTPEGCAIICDRNGKVIFYTDGDKVYDKNDLQIASGIGGNPLASQSSIIVPVPGDETLYYIFTNEAINGTSTNTVKYSLFDLKLNGGLGAVVEQNKTLFSKSTERITASGQWVILHEYGNNTFRVYPISNAGIGEPVLTAIGSDHNYTPIENGEGYMKLGPRNTLAVALSTPGVSNLIEVFHLNDSTGKLTNYRKVDLKQAAGEVYGIEFSPGGNKLFATVKGTPSPSQVFEYFIDSIGHIYFKQRVQQPLELGALQIGPNGQIYMAINGSNVLGTILAQDDTTQLSSFNFNGFALAPGTLSKLGLPNFRQQVSNATGGPGIDVVGLCFGKPTQFIGTATDPIDNFFWAFGDGATDNVDSPVHTYAAAGPYTVSMRLTNRCGLDTTLVKPITIFSPPANPTIPPAAALCNGPITLDANTGNVPGLTYLWVGGETTKTIVVNDQSFINVTITDTNGCTSFGQSLIVDNRPQVDIGPDQTACQGTTLPALDAQNPGNNYAWTVNGGGLTTAQSRAVDSSVPGVFDYQVIVTDPITTCTVTDNAEYTFVASPTFALSKTDPSVCNVLDGTLTLQINVTAPPTGPYTYSVLGPGSYLQQAIDQPAPQSVLFSGLDAGVYSVNLYDQISGCSVNNSIGLSAAPFTASAAALAPNCDPVTLQITTNAGSLPLQYTIVPNGPGTSVPATSVPTAIFNTLPVTGGTYNIQIDDALGCTFTITNFVVTPNPPTAFTINPSVCNTPPTIAASAPAGSTYTWVGPGIVGPNTNPIIQVSGQGSFTYTLTATAPGNCPGTQSITVELDNPAPDFVQSDPCQNAITLTASPSGSYTYRWSRGGVFDPALLGQVIALGAADNGLSFQTELTNAVNGCRYLSPAKAVQILGVVDATLTSTPVCDDNKAFTLTAGTSATGVTYAWFKNSVLIPSLSTASVNQTDAGTYKVEISKTAACKATADIIIIKAPIPIGKLPDRKIICNDPENKDPNTSQVDLDPGSFNKYDWFKNDLNIGFTQRVLTASSQGKYRVDLTNSFGCVASDFTEVRNECIPRLDVPNAFRPSSTIAENKDFYVFSFFITDNFQVFIYNRWGELVYTSSDRYFKWNGGLNNSLSQPLPGGAYAYVIKYVSAFHPERGILERRGGVALLR